MPYDGWSDRDVRKLATNARDQIYLLTNTNAGTPPKWLNIAVHKELKKVLPPLYQKIGVVETPVARKLLATWIMYELNGKVKSIQEVQETLKTQFIDVPSRYFHDAHPDSIFILGTDEEMMVNIISNICDYLRGENVCVL